MRLGRREEAKRKREGETHSEQLLGSKQPRLGIDRRTLCGSLAVSPPPHCSRPLHRERFCRSVHACPHNSIRLDVFLGSIEPQPGMLVAVSDRSGIPAGALCSLEGKEPTSIGSFVYEAEFRSSAHANPCVYGYPVRGVRNRVRGTQGPQALFFSPAPHRIYPWRYLLCDGDVRHLNNDPRSSF